MIDRRFLVVITAGLLTLSLGIYLIHFYLFADAHHILIFLVSDIAFVPIEVLLVTLILHRLLESRERAEKLEKMNMLIGAFFSTLGTTLLEAMVRADPNTEVVRQELIVQEKWLPADFDRVRKKLHDHRFTLAAGSIDFTGLQSLLESRKEFLIRLIENPVILEHEHFTELIRTIFHATEEFDHRGRCTDLPITDRMHLASDLNRIYTNLVFQWIDYMEYLSGNYPYLFSLAMRTNPFDPSASVVVRQVS